jgi:hypothetical protein
MLQWVILETKTAMWLQIRYGTRQISDFVISNVQIKKVLKVANLVR